MNKKLSIACVLLLMFSCMILGQGTPKLLKIEEPAPGTQKKFRLLVDMGQLQNILSGMGLDGVSGNIDLGFMNGLILANLGKVKKGNIKWSGKIADGKMPIKVSEDEYGIILKRINEKAMNPGYQVILSEARTNNVLKTQEISFADYSELQVLMEYPINTTPGAQIGDQIKITVENRGLVKAENVVVELVLSKDIEIPVKVATYSELFSEDCLLKDGRFEIPALDPGEKRELEVRNSIKLPDEMEPGKYYLGVTIDPADQVKELKEDNNVFSGFFILAVPPPKLITLEFPDLQMEFVPNPYGYKLIDQGAELSNAREWRICTIRPNLYQLRHVNWKNKHYELNSQDRSVWLVSATAFCKTGGKAKEMKVAMDVSGFSSGKHPKKLTMKFPDSRIIYDPASGDFKFMCHGIQLAHLPFWRVLRMQAHIYQIKFNFWEDFFWEVDTYNKTIQRVSGVNFGTPEGGERNPLTLQLKIDE